MLIGSFNPGSTVPRFHRKALVHCADGRQGHSALAQHAHRVAARGVHHHGGIPRDSPRFVAVRRGERIGVSPRQVVSGSGIAELQSVSLLVGFLGHDHFLVLKVVILVEFVPEASGNT